MSRYRADEFRKRYGDTPEAAIEMAVDEQSAKWRYYEAQRKSDPEEFESDGWVWQYMVSKALGSINQLCERLGVPFPSPK